MSDLADYFSDKDRIKELEFKLNNSRRTASRYKRLYEDLKGEKVKSRGDRGEKAMSLIKQLKNTDRPVNLIRAIAKKCFLSEKTVNQLWYAK